MVKAGLTPMDAIVSATGDGAIYRGKPGGEFKLLVGELGATMMMTYNPHTISIQIFEDNAIGGLTQAVPGILLVVTLPILVIVIFYVSRKNKGHGLLRLG